MGGKQILQSMNGKKRYVFGGVGAAISMPFLISFLINLNSTVVATETQVDINTDEIKELRKLPVEFATLKQKVESESEADAEFRIEQRVANDRLYDAIIAK